jgi:hypothetical protein
MYIEDIEGIRRDEIKQVTGFMQQYVFPCLTDAKL